VEKLAQLRVLFLSNNKVRWYDGDGSRSLQQVYKPMSSTYCPQDPLGRTTQFRLVVETCPAAQQQPVLAHVLTKGGVQRQLQC
jgi:GrpB-like predicted nucleotidyltransferase (UPF0157 family)